MGEWEGGPGSKEGQGALLWPADEDPGSVLLQRTLFFKISDLQNCFVTLLPTIN